jgi:hypothetical protein
MALSLGYPNLCSIATFLPLSLFRFVDGQSSKEKSEEKLAGLL